MGRGAFALRVSSCRTSPVASYCEAIGTADESKRVSDIFSGGDNQGDATDSLFVSILRAGCETAGVEGCLHGWPGQSLDMKSDFAPAKIALTAGATGSDRGTTRWCCARPRRSSSTGALASMTSARAPIVSRAAGRPRIEPGNRRPTCLVEER